MVGGLNGKGRIGSVEVPHPDQVGHVRPLPRPPHTLRMSFANAACRRPAVRQDELPITSRVVRHGAKQLHLSFWQIGLEQTTRHSVVRRSRPPDLPISHKAVGRRRRCRRRVRARFAAPDHQVPWGTSASSEKSIRASTNTNLLDQLPSPVFGTIAQCASHLGEPTD